MDVLQNLLNTICKTGIFIICAQSILSFKPKEEYEKYLKLLVGVMILAQLFQPIGNLLAGKSDRKKFFLVEEVYRNFQTEWMRGMEEKDRAERLLEKMSEEKARQIMNESSEEGNEEPKGIDEITVSIQ